MGLLQLLFFMKPKDVYDCVNWLLILLMMFCTVSIIKFSSMYNSCKDSRDQIMEVNMEEPWIWNNFSQQQASTYSYSTLFTIHIYFSILFEKKVVCSNLHVCIFIG